MITGDLVVFATGVNLLMVNGPSLLLTRSVMTLGILYLGELYFMVFVSALLNNFEMEMVSVKTV